MKNSLKFLIVAILALSFLSSCTVQKRLHNSGYHITWNKSWKQHANNANAETYAAQETKATVNKEAVHQTTTPVAKNNVKIALVDEVKATTKAEVTTNKDIASTNNTIVSTKKETQKTYQQIKYENDELTHAAQQKIKANNTTVNIANSKGSGGSNFSGGMLVLMVILCLFPLINLIPVYLHDGTVTLNFWITLVLALLVIGSVIFSLLVIFGIVDLS